MSCCATLNETQDSLGDLSRILQNNKLNDSQVGNETQRWRFTKQKRRSPVTFYTGPRWLPTRDMCMEMDVGVFQLHSEKLRKLLEKFTQTKKVPRHREKLSALATEILENVADLKVTDRSQYLWYMEFICRFSLMNVQPHDPFLLPRVIGKLKFLEDEEFLCPVFLENAARRLHPIFDDIPENLEAGFSAFGSTSSAAVFMHACLSSVAIKTYLGIKFSDFYPWNVQNFLPFLEDISFNPKTETEEAVKCLRVISAYLESNLNCHYIEEFRKNPEFSEYFPTTLEQRKEIKAKLRTWGEDFLAKTAAANPDNKDSDMVLLCVVLTSEFIADLREYIVKPQPPKPVARYRKMIVREASQFEDMEIYD